MLIVKNDQFSMYTWHLFSFYVYLYIELLKTKLQWKCGDHDSHWEEPYIYIYIYEYDKDIDYVNVCCG